MRLWMDEEPGDKEPVRRDYETVGYVLKGRAELTLEGQTVRLEAGDSWVVPHGAEHSYRILETFSAVEAHEPARGGSRAGRRKRSTSNAEQSFAAGRRAQRARIVSRPSRPMIRKPAPSSSGRARSSNVTTRLNRASRMAI